MDVLTKSVNIYTVPRTDHLAVHLSISFDAISKGNSYWKFNNEWLKNHEFSQNLSILIDECVNKYGELLSSAELWCLCKNKIRTFSIEFASRHKQSTNNNISEVECKLQNAYIDTVKHPADDDLKSVYNKLKFENEVLNEHYLKGLQIRSKAKWVEDGEKSTKFFLNLEKNNISRKSVTILNDSHGISITDQDKILDEEVNYFSSLYKSQNNTSQTDLHEFFDNVDIPKLTDDEKLLCNGELTKSECIDAINGMARNKSPGYDGITVEFYCKYWPKVGQLDDAFEASQRGV